MEIKMIKCIFCKTSKEETLFYPCMRGYETSSCRECSLKNSKRYYNENKEHIKQSKKKYYETYKEDLLERDRNYYQANKEKINTLRRTTPEKTPEILQALTFSCATCKYGTNVRRDYDRHTKSVKHINLQYDIFDNDNHQLNPTHHLTK